MLLPALALVSLGGAIASPGSTRSRAPNLDDLEAALRASTGETFGATTSTALARSFFALDPSMVPDDLLVAIVIAGTTSRDPVDVARELLQRSGSLAEIARSDVIRETVGINEAGRARLLAASELSRRAAYRETAGRTVKVNSAADAVAVLRTMDGQDVEWLAALYLDRGLKVIASRILSRGSVAATVLDPRQILKAAIEQNASHLVLAHNHPSGDPEPSTLDLDATRVLVTAGRMLGIMVVDHIVLGSRGRYVSMAERGLIPST